jgi:hypothetical protein
MFTDHLKGTVQQYFNFVLFTHTDRPRPEYKSLLILKFFRDAHDLITKTTFFMKLRRTIRKKLYCSENVLFRQKFVSIFFFHYKFISGTCFLTIKRFRKAANKLEV